ncbi:MAG: bZIP transcription factor [Aestuariivirga sp.]|nr:bZIP transcription factor [Aestuariivirga sp.]
MTVSITFTGETEADVRRQAAEFGSETAQRALQQVDDLTREVEALKAEVTSIRTERDFLRREVARLKADPAPTPYGWRSPDSGSIDVSDYRWVVILDRDNQILPPMRASVLLDSYFRKSIRAFAEVPKPKGWWPCK